ncbi:MAG: hypothetical protein FK733_00775 [Asgard group archaeon]|nr:hypothetical protein [Asgard group archaeon]
MKKNGFDIVVKSDFLILTFKEHSYFDEEKIDLPKPFKSGGFTLSAKFMNHFKIKTMVDLARYIRIISVILTYFKGPKTNDHLDFHIFALQQTIGKPRPNNEEEVMKALLIYNDVFGSKMNLPKEDYLTFARILNQLYKIYDPPKGQEPIVATTDTFDDDWDDFGYEDESEEEYDAAKKFDTYVNWVYKDLFKDFNDEKLLVMLKDDMQRNTLMLSLKQNNLGEYSDDQLKDLIKNKKDRDKLIKKVNEWYVKAFPS